MILQKLKRILSAVIIVSMIGCMPVSAGDIQGPDSLSGAEDIRESDAPSGAEDIQGPDTSSGAEDIRESDTLSADGAVIESEDRNGEISEDTEPERKELVKEETDEAKQPDDRTRQLADEYGMWLRRMRAQSVGSYSTELAKFPESYQTYLKQLHAKHPNWVFVAVDRNLNWDDIVSAESVSGTSKGTNRSLLPKTSDGLLLSKASTDYHASKGTYIPKDGSTWVSASKPAVAYYTDPRNFLTDYYIYMFEALKYDPAYHKEEGVSNVLKGTDLYGDKQIVYTKTNGNKASLDLTYEQAVFAAGAKNQVSPLFLAAKIRQETGGKLTNGSISGTFSYGGTSYRGYYNFYNIGAYSTSTGSAVANGLVFAKGGKDKLKTYKRPWTSPVLAIDGGAEYIAKSYISKGQNTVYFQRFNTAAAPYYQHQYMQNLTAAASEARTTYNSYSRMGILNDAFVFYIPVYKNMPSQSGGISIRKSEKTGTTTSAVTMRSTPSAGGSSVMKVPKGEKVTVSGAEYTDMTASVSSQEENPYWFKVACGSKTGYIASRYIKMTTDSTVKEGGTKQLSVTGAVSGEKIYYETSDPAVAVVSSTGKITGVKKGTCDIYAVTSSGKQMDAVGISVSGGSELSRPKLISVLNSKSGIVIKWKKASNAKGYYIYRKKEGGSYKKIKKITSGKTVKYTDKTMAAGKKYVYTVKAYNGSRTSSYNKTGLAIRRLSNPALVSASGTKSGIKVKWKKVKSAVTYEVFRRTKGGKYKKIASVKNGKQAYTDKTAAKGKTYYYTVRACSGIYKGAYTESGKRGKRK